MKKTTLPRKYIKPKHISKLNQSYSENYDIIEEKKFKNLNTILKTPKAPIIKEKHSLLIFLTALSEDHNLLKFLSLIDLDSFLKLLNLSKIKSLKVKNDFITFIHNNLLNSNNKVILEELASYYPLSDSIFFTLVPKQLIFYEKEQISIFMRKYEELTSKNNSKVALDLLSEDFDEIIIQEKKRLHFLYKVAHTEKNRTLRNFKSYIEVLAKYISKHSSTENNRLYFREMFDQKLYKTSLCLIKDINFLYLLRFFSVPSTFQEESQDIIILNKQKQLKSYFYDINLILDLLFLSFNEQTFTEDMSEFLDWLQGLEFKTMSGIFNSISKVDTYDFKVILSDQYFIIYTKVFSDFTILLLNYFFSKCSNNLFFKNNLNSLLEEIIPPNSNTPNNKKHNITFWEPNPDNLI